jgi:hypothetical protein
MEGLSNSDAMAMFALLEDDSGMYGDVIFASVC